MVTQCQKKSRHYLGGCKEAKLLVARKVSCIENCPFTECLECLNEKQRVGIRVVLRKQKKIKKVYKLCDEGSTQDGIANNLRLPLGTVSTWIVKREKYEQIFKGDISGLLNGNGKVNE